MTKAKSDHGGKRIGAGRKAKPRAGPIRMAGVLRPGFETPG